MSSTSVVILVVVIVVVLAVVAALVMVSRRRALQRRFGPEYDRAVAQGDSRLAAERELRERERRHAQLELRELTPESRERYALPGTRSKPSSWTSRTRPSAKPTSSSPG